MSLANTTIALDEAIDSTCKTARILIVEDDANHRFFLKKSLNNEGYENIEEAANGSEGYLKTLSFHPQIVILDLMMPICNGIEYLQRIRQHPEFAEIPVLVQTGLGDIEMHKKSFEAGATDLLTKPLDAEEFLARTRAHLERYELTKKLRRCREDLKEEMDVAKSMQHHFMPGAKLLKTLEQKYGLLASWHYEPSGKIGRDMWNAVSLDAHRLLIYTSGFSGLDVFSAIQSMRYHSTIQHMAQDEPDPGKLLTKLNRHISEMPPEERFSARMFVSILNRKTNTLTFSGAGTPAPFLLNPEQQRREALPVEGPLLGTNPEVDYVNHQTPFDKDDSLFIYSNALFFARFEDDRRVTEETVTAMLNKCIKQGTSLEERHKAFRECIQQGIENSIAEADGDLLLLLISRE